MERRGFLCFVGGLLASRVAARAQAGKVYRIGHLVIASPNDLPPPPPANWNAFVEGLSESGYAEGKNIVFEHRSAHGNPTLFPNLAAELSERKVDVIFARGTWALNAAKDATSTIPIVGIDLEIDPVASGLVESVARPGRNVTGLFLDLSELSGKHLQILREIAPGMSRVAFLGDPAINKSQLGELERVAGSLSVETRLLDPVQGAADAERAFEEAKRWGAHAVVVLSNPLLLAFRTLITGLASRAALPAIHLYRVYVHAGGLISYGPDLPDMFRRCGVYVARILGGAKAGDLPIERPARFELALNVKAAKALNLRIPETIMVRADEVIE
jgi:putative ABC transport system substrate-binding protein